MGEVQWIKLYIDMFNNNRKTNKIRRMPDGDRILLFWIMLLATAGNCNAGGMIFITERVPFTEQDLAGEFDLEEDLIEHALQAFADLDMISIDDEGFIFIRNWEKYQSADKLAELRAKDRERKRKKRAQAKDEYSEDVRGQSEDSPSIEEEREEDEELDQEFHSFTHSNARESEYDEDEPVENSADKESLKLKYLGGTLGKGVVMLSDEQFYDLLDKLSLDEFNKYVSIVADCELSGQHYKKKTHYQAILDMARKDRKLKGGKSK